MNENNRREWVKNAIIIFLIIMLLLTFFSNTIMNYSLPEVSAKYVEGGTLSEQIRGSGEVKANQTYELKMGETRTIASVEVKAGDVVEKGQVIYKLEDRESDELAAAEKNLRAAKKAYNEALLSAGYDHRADELDIARQEEDLELLKKELPKISGYAAAYKKAKDKVRDIEAEIKDLEKDIKQYDDTLSILAGDDYSSLSAADYAKITQAKKKLEDAEKTKTASEKKIEEYESKISDAGDQSKITAAKRAIEEKELSISQAKESINNEYMKENPDMSVINSLQASITQYELELKYLKEEYNNILADASTDATYKQRLHAEQITLNMNTETYDKAKKDLDDLIASLKQDAKAKADAIQEKIDAANIRLNDAKTEMEEAEGKASMTVEEQETKIRNAENELEKSKISLSNKQKEEAITAGKEALNIQELQAAVDDAQSEIDRLKKDSIGVEITAPVGGKIASLSFSAGEEAAKDAPAASIEMTEKGYTIEITATTEQAKKVRVGDEAEIEYFWGGDASAKLISIDTDKSNPSRSRILTFAVTGDIAPGQTLQIAMGSKGQRYEYIVPNSAVREDNNGKFLLAVRSKSSPLGNRYMAERIDVDVIASDDTSSAVSGNIFNGDFIITISTSPIKPGDQVRLEAN